MRNRIPWLCGLLWYGLVVSSLVGQQPAAPSLPVLAPHDVFDLEYASDPRISPDGKWIAYCRVSFDIMTDRSRSRLWQVGIAGDNHRPLTAPDVNATSPRWSPDGSRLAYVASDGKKSQVFVRWMDTGQTAQITSLREPPRQLKWSPDGQSLAFASLVPDTEPFKLDLPKPPAGAQWAEPPKVISQLKYRADGEGYLRPGYQHLFVVPSDGGTARQVTTGNFQHDGDFCWTSDSSELLFCANRSEAAEIQPNRRNLFAVQLDSGEIRQLTDRQGETTQPVVLDDGSILFLGNVDNLQGYQPLKIYLLKPDGQEQVISSELDRNIRGLQVAPQSQDLLFLYDDEGRTDIGKFTLNGEFQKLASDVGGTTLGRPYASGSFTVAGNDVVAFTACTADRPSDVACWMPDGNVVKKLTRLNEDLLAHRELGKVTPNWFSSSFDNRRIQSWIMTPPGFDPQKKYPLILEIHGGPFANYGPRFSAEMQLMAAAGYVVLYVNPRGSTSYGEEFGNLIHHNYPGNDFDDLMSAVDSVIEQGFVDSTRLYVTGGSGGGVLTAWIVGKTNRFQAAVVAKPVINWYSFALTADSYAYFYKYWFPGYRWDHAEHYLARSPISLVGNVETPTMLLTGEEDYRTPISESEQFYQALKLRQVKTALVRIPDAGHGIVARPSRLLTKVACILSWFEKNTKK